jgi:aryl-alcohol dehydrogenase-like predicted oxidoreductase
VIARVPFDEGSLTGTMHAGMSWPEGDWRNWYFTRDKLAETLGRVDAVRGRPAAGPDSAGGRAALHPGVPDVSTVIPGMRRPRHVEQNLAVSEAGPLDPDLVRGSGTTVGRGRMLLPDNYLQQGSPAGLYFLLCV